jgi:hypothetical protein
MESVDGPQVIPERKVPDRRLGRHLNHDPRSLRYLVNTPARTLNSVEHERIIPVLDQGDLGSCTGNAAVGALGTQPLYDALTAHGPAVTNSLNEALAQDIYSEATNLDPFDGHWPPEDTGSDGVSAAKACAKRGLIPGYTHATSLAAMQAALQDTPVIVGVNWYEGFDNPTAAGTVHISGSIRGGHEFEVIGLNIETKVFHAVNSWGDGWGLHGHFWVSFADMDRLLHEDGDCTQLLPLTVPAPTPAPLNQADIDLITAMDPWANQRYTWLPTGKAGRARAGYLKWKQANGV